jgi:hypothetical protein
MSVGTPTVYEPETRNALQSRWGWHPCDYETYLKLKDLNKVYIRERNYFHALCRQLVKAPRHRTHSFNCVSVAMNLKGPFITQYRENVRGGNGWGGEWWYRSMPSSPKHEFGYAKRYPAQFSDLRIPVLYGLAKRPNPTPSPIPFNQIILNHINLLHGNL